MVAVVVGGGSRNDGQNSNGKRSGGIHHAPFRGCVSDTLQCPGTIETGLSKQERARLPQKQELTTLIKPGRPGSNTHHPPFQSLGRNLDALAQRESS